MDSTQFDLLPSTGPPIDSLRGTRAPMRGLLVRQMPVRLVNVSLSGFLLESRRQINVGITGEFRVDFGGAEYRDQVRMSRSIPRPGSGHLFHVGGEFSWGDRPAKDSLRKAVRTFESDQAES